MSINVEAFIDSLSIMGQGMAGIFTVTIAIIISIYVLNEATRPSKKKKK